MHINLATYALIYLCCYLMWVFQLNHIGLCIWVRVLLPPSRASVLPPFLHQPPSKNEVPHVLIHPNKITQRRLCPVYQPSQKSTHISTIIELYVRQVCHHKFPRCCLDNYNEAEFMLQQFFRSRHCLFIPILPKSGADLYFLLRDSISKSRPIPKFETCS